MNPYRKRRRNNLLRARRRARRAHGRELARRYTIVDGWFRDFARNPQLLDLVSSLDRFGQPKRKQNP